MMRASALGWATGAVVAVLAGAYDVAAVLILAAAGTLALAPSPARVDAWRRNHGRDA